MSQRALYELATYQNGRAFRPDETRGSAGMPIVKIAEMNSGVGSKTGVFEGDVDPRYRITAGDLLFAWSGSIVIQRWAGPDAILNQHIFKVTAKPGVRQDYLRYLLETQIPAFNLIVLDQRTTMGHVKVADLKRMVVDVPEEDVQREIAETLRAIDDKIDLNRSLTELIPKLIRARVEAELGSGGDVPVGVLASFVNGGAYTKGASGSGRMVLRIAELNSGPGRSTVYNDIEVPEDKTARAGDILMSWSGSLGVYRWFRDEAIINQHIFKVIPDAYPSWLVFDRLDAVMPIFRNIAQDKATTMGHIQRGHLDSTTIRIPSSDVISQLDSELDPLWQRLLLAEQENMRLEALRAVLLPAIFSGRLRVSEAEGVPA